MCVVQKKDSCLAQTAAIGKFIKVQRSCALRRLIHIFHLKSTETRGPDAHWITLTLIQ